MLRLYSTSLRLYVRRHTRHATSLRITPLPIISPNAYGLRAVHPKAMNLRIVFMGTPEFAVPALEALLADGQSVVAVVTAPDKPAGRGQQLSVSPVKACALAHGLPVLQPEKLRAPAFLEALRGFAADLQVVVAFRMLPEVVWAMPPLGTFNLHASLLPQYRGAAPINWAIMHGETQTGVTTFFLQKEIDTGDLLFQESEPIHPDDNAGTLYERLRQRGAGLVVRTVRAIAEGTVQPVPQPAVADLRLAPKIFREDCQVRWAQPAGQVVNFVRGLAPYPSAWTEVRGQPCKLFRMAALPAAEPLPPGEWATDQKSFWHVGTTDGRVAIEELQMAGKRRMSITEFLRGYTL